MTEFTKTLFADLMDSSVGANIVNDSNNLIINEAIILDKLNGNKEALNEFYNNLGKFGSRDGILSESAVTDIALKSFDDEKCGETCAVLTVAKEAGCKDYEIYCKALLLMRKCMENMKQNFGDIAKDRLEAQKQEVENNIRVSDALDKTVIDNQ